VLADAATESKSGKADKAGSVALIDADAVFSYQCVKRMNESASCVVEIVKSQNVGYLDPQAVVQSGGHIEYKFTPQFASGALFTSSLLDTLVCQAFYNPKIISVISELFSGVERKNRNELLANIRGDTKTEKKGVAAIVGSTLYQISVPELESRTYGSLFRHLCNEGIIPLGLYRGIFSHMNIGPKQNKSCYCFTNPSKDTELFSCDKVYVLSPRPLIASSKKNVKMAEAAMTRKVNENSTSNHDVRHEILRVEGNLNERMSRLEDMVAHSFDTILETVNDIGAK
jgi:potassium large conductance calcium-activated channel subfamily M alpha protein 1